MNNHSNIKECKKVFRYEADFFKDNLYSSLILKQDKLYFFLYNYFFYFESWILKVSLDIYMHLCGRGSFTNNVVLESLSK